MALVHSVGLSYVRLHGRQKGPCDPAAAQRDSASTGWASRRYPQHGHALGMRSCACQTERRDHAQTPREGISLIETGGRGLENWHIDALWSTEKLSIVSRGNAAAMKFIRILMLLFVSPYTHAQSSPLVNLQQVSCDVGLANPQGQGRCSWHGGECGCSSGRDVCCDGSYSPTRGCHSAGLQLADEYVHGYLRSDGT